MTTTTRSIGPSSTFNRRVQLQRPSTSQDSFGQPTTVWTTAATVWASMHALTMKQLYQSGLFASQVTHKIMIRWPGAHLSINTGWRVVYHNATENIDLHYSIQAIDNSDQKNRTLEILCVQINEGD